MKILHTQCCTLTALQKWTNLFLEKRALKHGVRVRKHFSLTMRTVTTFKECHMPQASEMADGSIVVWQKEHIKLKEVVVGLLFQHAAFR